MSNGDFKELVDYCNEVRNSEKKVVLEYEEGKELEFTIEMLSQAQKDKVADFKDVETDERGNIKNINVDTKSAQVYLIKEGLVDNPEKQPEGFNYEDIENLLPEMREFLATKIRDFSRIDEVVREKFC